jgi:NhaA family Na+:H+ antiporter
MNERPSSQAAQRLIAFINHEATAGLILALAAAAALIADNIEALRPFYGELLDARVSVTINDLGLTKPLLLWINDGLMAVFFFLVGLEIKREVLEGSLSSRDQIMLPALAAVGGMAAPALIYCFITWDNPDLLRGWAIPAATDIAFALGALSLVGQRAPLALKVFLLTLATLDDLGSIVIIALFYTAKLSVLSLGLAAVALAALLILNRMHVSRIAPYMFIGIAMWLFVLKSGIHATLAGVALAMMVPLNRKDGSALIHAIEEGLHPYVKFAILPLFAFANAGVPLDGFSLATLLEPLPLAIGAGLAIGKPLGILLVVGAAVSMGIARLPEDVSWRQIAGVGCLAGIGFTMSLFIGMLAFEDAAHAAGVRFGVIAGSLVSIGLGLGVLFASQPARSTVVPNIIKGEDGDV